MVTVFEATVTATFDDLAGGSFQRLFDFSNGEGVDNIWLGNVWTTDTIAFEVFQNGTRYRLEVPAAIDEGVETTWNVTIDDAGALTIFKDGTQIGLQSFGVGAVPNDVPRSESLIGDSSFAVDDPLIGTVRSIDVETTLTHGFDIVFTDTTNRVGSFDGTDQAEVLNASGSTGADSLAGDSGDDSLYGGGGDDALYGGQGGDSIAGGAGADAIFGDGISYSLGDFASGDGAATNLTVTNGADGPISLWWIDRAGALQFYRTIQAGDTYVQRTFEDHNWLLLDRDGNALDLIMGAPNQTVTYGADGLDDSIDGGTGYDTIHGQFGGDTITGGAGSDQIFGGDGDDSILGGEDDDTIRGGAGDDTIDVGTHLDIAYGEDGNDLLIDGTIANGGSTLYGGDGNDTIQSDFGGAFGLANYYGGAGDDRLEDRGGTNQTFDGGTGSDTYVALSGIGNDTVIGGEDAGDTDTDVIDLSAMGDGVSVTFTGPEAGMITDGTGTLAFSGIEQVVLTGGADVVDATGDPGGVNIDGSGGDDTITGSAGDDTITGGTGNDVIAGGAGNDLLTGGAGNDEFAYTPGDGLDTITDFNSGTTGAIDDGDSTNNDFIDLSGFYDHISELYADQADDGILNQSNTTDTRGNAVDYADNTRFDTNGTPGDEGIRFTGATADSAFFTVENTGVVCFTSGTLIATPRGEIPIEMLKPGDLVLTRDNGPQPLIWIGRRHVGHSELARNDKLRPVEIKPTLIGAHSRLVVSRQHGVLLRTDGQETLVRAIYLAKLAHTGARIMHGCRGVTYFHLMFEAHQVIFAAGAPCESFFPGPQALGALAPPARKEILTLFPTLPREPARELAHFKGLGDAVLQIA